MKSYLADQTQRRAAIDYISLQLARGKALAKLLLENLNFDIGTITALNPAPLEAKQVMQFSWGHLHSDEHSAVPLVINGEAYSACQKANSYEQLAEIITSLQGPEEICIFENPLATAGDPWLRGAKSRVSTYDHDVYHILTFADLTGTNIENTLREANGFPAPIGALGPRPSDPIFESPRHVTISAEHLTGFVRGVHSLFVGAYDGEGYLIWEGPVAQ